MKSDEVISGATRLHQGCLQGVYYLIKDGVIVYVGQSTNVYARIGAHIAEGSKDFDSYTFVNVPREDMSRIETEEIIVHRPKYNSMLPQNDSYKTRDRLKEILNLNVYQIKKIIRKNGIIPIYMCGGTFYKLSDFTEDK